MPYPGILTVLGMLFITFLAHLVSTTIYKQLQKKKNPEAFIWRVIIFILGFSIFLYVFLGIMFPLWRH